MNEKRCQDQFCRFARENLTLDASNSSRLERKSLCFSHPLQENQIQQTSFSALWNKIQGSELTESSVISDERGFVVLYFLPSVIRFRT